MHWGARVGLAAVFAGLIALAAQVSVPLPWTPVPFTMSDLAVLIAGAILGRNYGLLSVTLYLVAGAIGIEVFADQESSGLAVLSGYTAGYLFAFPLAAYYVGWYVERRRRLLTGRWMTAALAGVGVLGLLALATWTWIATQGGRFESTWSATQSYLWLFLGMAGVAALAVGVLLIRHRGLGWEKLNLLLVMLAAVAIIHVPGVIVLKLLWPFEPDVGWGEAAGLGSTVFLPFDIAKAGLAAAVTVAFLPTRDDERHSLSQKQPET
jgi:biotin transport system substrate-specific component